jgi:hypothetical protein
MKSKLLLILILISSAILSSGCGSVAELVGGSQKCVVIAKRAQIRSSGAVVAADLLEVSRGQTLEVLDETTFENEKWYNVRASDEENTEGWIEARYVIAQNQLEKSQKIADEFKDIPGQAVGQLRAASNLRLSPEISDDNILLKLLGGDTFEIVGWKRVPKSEDREKDDAPKGGGNNQANNAGRNAKQKDVNAPQLLNDKYDVWYKVRLDPSVSPAPAGWVYGRQVELAVPADIIYYRTGREFVAWRKLDGDDEKSSAFINRKDMSREEKPGNWVILEKSSILQEPNGEEPDFDRIKVIGYDKYNKEHFQVYRSGNVKGFLPLRVSGMGDSRVFSVQLKAGDGQLRDVQFQAYKDARGNIRIKVPDNIPKDDKGGD